MKRAAERQLVKNDMSDESEEKVPEQPEPFQKADESVLAARKIRALPKRSLAGSSSASAPGSSSAPKFTGFAGFGSSAPKPNPFSHTPSSSTSNPAPTTALPSIPLPVAPSASAATRTFASFLGSSPPSSATLVASPTDAKSPEPTALKYYTSLRGLNVSFLSAVSAAIDQDPFSDVSNLLERYKDLRIAVQNEFDDKVAQAKGTAIPKNGTTTVPIQSEKPTMVSTPPPVPPTGFAGFSALSSNTSTSSVSGPGFFPKSDTATSAKPGFSFSSSSATIPTTSASPAPPAFSFSIPPALSSLPAAPVQSVFGSSSPSDASSKILASSPKNSGIKSAFSAPGVSSSTSPSFFLNPSSSTGSPFSGFGTPSAPSKDKGIGPSSTSTSSPFGNKSDTTAPPSLFGTAFGSSTTAKGPFGNFGQPSGSIGNPLGFGFGTAPKATPTGDTALATTSTSTSTFSFATPPPPKSSTATTPEIGDTEGTPAPSDGEAGDSTKLFETKSHDLEGEGEEDEETTHTVRAKVFKLSQSNGEKNWADMGVGMLRLKKHKAKGSRRALLRNSNTGKITINFNLYAEMEPSVTGKVVAFVGHENGAHLGFRLRLRSEDDAVELKKALDREIDLVKAKSSG